MEINVRMEILAILANDDEGIDQIVGILEYDFGNIVHKTQISAEIKKLLAERLICVAYYDKEYYDYADFYDKEYYDEEGYKWYEMTSKGRAAFEAFDWDTYFEEIKFLRKEED
ncbi:MAG: hypothetical protein ACOX05_02940 [Bacillota bacterium]|jgi:hypothetical protein